MYHSVTEMCKCAHFCYKMVHWDIWLMHCWICQLGLLSPSLYPSLQWNRQHISNSVPHAVLSVSCLPPQQYLFESRWPHCLTWSQGMRSCHWVQIRLCGVKSRHLQPAGETGLGIKAGVTSLNSSPPGQNGRHFADNIFRCIFVNEKFCILIKISLKFVPRGPIDNNLALV